jgi:anti-anti-sigma factor
VSELPGERFRIEIVSGVDPVLVRLDGEFDVHAAPNLHAALAPLSSRRVEIDCTDVRFIDSSGINVLLGQVRRSRLAGGHAGIIHVPSQMLRVLEVTGCLGLLTEPPGGSARGPRKRGSGPAGGPMAGGW